MIGEANPWNEEQHFRRDAINGSRKLLIALLRLNGIEIRAERQKAVRKYPPRPDVPFPPNPIVWRIQQAVADHYGFHENYLYLTGRHRWYSRPRQVVMHLAQKRGVSLKCIGRHFGFDHTTVLFGCRAVARNPELLAVANSLSPEIRLIHSQKEPETAINAPVSAIEQSVKMQAESIAA